MRKRFVILSLGVATAACLGCAPETPYRYSAMFPAARPAPWDGRTASPGSLRLEGTASVHATGTVLAPREHDTAAHVPGAMVEGFAGLALTRGVELGARGAWAEYGWAQRSAVGTMPLPSRPTLLGAGPELRFAVPLDREGRVAIGLLGNAVAYAVPYAEWTRDAATGNPVATYHLTREGSSTHWLLAFGAYPSVNLGADGAYGRVVGLVACHAGLRNDGFTDTRHAGSAVESAGLVGMAGGGYAVDLAPFHASALAWIPFTANDDVRARGGAAVTIGVDLDLWATERDR